jgi:hypothetical protein
MAFTFKSAVRSKRDMEATGLSFAEELLSNADDWRGVPDIVKLTFKTLADSMKTQGLTIGELERQVAGKATKAELSLSLGNKANVTDVNQAISSLNLARDRSLPLSTYDPILKDKVSRSELDQFVREDRLHQLLSQYTPFQDLDAAMQDMQRGLEEERKSWTSALSRLGKEVADLARLTDSKADQSEIERLNSAKANRQSVVSALHSKVNKEELDSVLGRKANVEHVEAIVAELSSLRASIDLRKPAEEAISIVQRLDAELSRTRLSLEDRLTHMEEELTAVKGEWRSSMLDITARKQVDLAQYAQTLPRTDSKELNAIRQDLAGCVRTKELYHILDDRAEAETQLRRELEAIAAENCLGMWLWTSGVLPGGGKVPWEVQASNSQPENFVWTRDGDVVVTVAPGLYEVSVGVFARVRPRASLALNEVVVARLGWDQDSTKLWSPHPDGNLIGLTYFDSFALPPSCRISLVLDTTTRAEAYLRLRKL